MAVRTKRLWGPVAVPTAAPAILFTSPSGGTSILRALTTVNPTTTTPCRIRLWLNGTANANLIVLKPLGNPGDLANYDMWIVLQPGDVIRGQSEGATVSCAGYGSILNGVNPL